MGPTTPPPREPDTRPPREQRFDAITLVLVVVLAIIVFGAVGYGIYSSTRVATAIPSVVTTDHGIR